MYIVYFILSLSSDPKYLEVRKNNWEVLVDPEDFDDDLFKFENDVSSLNNFKCLSYFFIALDKDLFILFIHWMMKAKVLA